MKIAIVAPARKVTQEEMRYAVDWLEKNGMTAVYDERLFAENHIFAGTAEHRAAVIQEYLDRDDIDALWMARGGYGSLHVVDKLDFSRLKEHPKWLIGFSDITVFHGKMQRLGISTIHASMPYNFESKTGEAKQSLLDALMGKSLRYMLPESPYNRYGEAEAEIVGGNLSVLYSMMGSDSFPDTEGKILFIEEVDEYIYHIDRMMTALRRAGVLKGLKGLVVGGLTEIHDNPEPFGKTVEEVILEAVLDYDYPVCFNFPAGHFADNRALVLGRRASCIVAQTTMVTI